MGAVGGYTEPSDRMSVQAFTMLTFGIETNIVKRSNSNIAHSFFIRLP